MSRLGIVLTHPVQYYAPWFAYLAKHIDLHVFYGVQPSPEDQGKEFGVAFGWDVDLLSGYASSWLETHGSRPATTSGFFGIRPRSVLSELREHDISTVMTFGWNKWLYLRFLFAARLSGIPVYARTDSKKFDERKHRTRRFTHRPVLNRFNGFITAGIHSTRYLTSIGIAERKIVSLPHMTPESWIAQNPSDIECPAEIRSDHDLVVLFVGKLIARKRVDDLIRACLVCSKGGLRVQCVIVGDGDQREYLQALAGDYENIVFAGFKNQSALKNYYTHSDVLVLPSDEESWGLVVNECFATGTPAIVSDEIGCAPEMINPWTGREFPCGNVEALAQAMTSMHATLQSSPEKIKAALAQKVVETSYAESLPIIMNMCQPNPNR